MKKFKLLLFDLDGTLLQSEKTISTRTLSALKKCRENDILIGVSTSR
ncbi:MAG: HAD family hydrolase, partial [Oscillospiraceae bacterium]